MKDTTMMRILDHMIDNEMVRFEDDYGTVIEVFKTSNRFYEMSTRSKNGQMLSSTYFNRYESDGGLVRLYWGIHIVGMICSERLSKE